MRGAAQYGESDTERHRVEQGRRTGPARAALRLGGRRRQRPVHSGEPLLGLVGGEAPATGQQFVPRDLPQLVCGQQRGEQLGLGGAQVLQSDRVLDVPADRQFLRPGEQVLQPDLTVRGGGDMLLQPLP
ncbi:hypothetical protein [Streptomyces sp. RLA2-12]|uniref:hypothetical protein n=1 Tax=Streptomyces sp. RLA2-12 TaxID=2721242 RepID=UPI002006DE4F|nr:hypothetical protein [Streptomyces sp. RLA2-12]